MTSSAALNAAGGVKAVEAAGARVAVDARRQQLEPCRRADERRHAERRGRRREHEKRACQDRGPDERQRDRPQHRERTGTAHPRGVLQAGIHVLERGEAAQIDERVEEQSENPDHAGHRVDVEDALTPTSAVQPSDRRIREIDPRDRAEIRRHAHTGRRAGRGTVARPGRSVRDTSHASGIASASANTTVATEMTTVLTIA